MQGRARVEVTELFRPLFPGSTLTRGADQNSVMSNGGSRSEMTGGSGDWIKLGVDKWSMRCKDAGRWDCRMCQVAPIVDYGRTRGVLACLGDGGRAKQR